LQGRSWSLLLSTLAVLSVPGLGTPARRAQTFSQPLSLLCQLGLMPLPPLSRELPSIQRMGERSFPLAEEAGVHKHWQPALRFWEG